MKNIIVLFILLGFVSALNAQGKPILEQVENPTPLEELLNSIQPPAQNTTIYNRGEVNFAPATIGSILLPNKNTVGIKSQVTNHPITGRPAWIKLEGKDVNEGSPEAQCQKWFNTLANAWGIEKTETAFSLLENKIGPIGDQHLKWQQVQEGIPVYGNEIIAHFKDEKLFLMNGRVLPDANINFDPTVTESQAINIAKTSIKKHTHVKELSPQEQSWLGENILQTELVIFYSDALLTEAHLAWSVNMYPNLGAHWKIMIDAHSGEILRELDHVCHLMPPPPDGPQQTTAQDLTGQNRTIHSYRRNGSYFLIDASRSMFNSANSSFPDNGQGVIWTINGNNTSPAGDNFQATHVTSSTNSWNNQLAVSAHFNAGEAYRYYKETFNRNSINGQGGNILSFINVSDDDGSDMDNAFWNGQAMFYGNGNTDFIAPLAKSLDVAGHEMSHGVIQSTANLEYYGESGALNESFADVFAVMIDRDDWKVGEGIVNTNTFPSNALRDLSNPHNGGSQLGSPGWQPEHTNEQFTGSQDNGGVHINSGIPNRAFFLFATAIGKAKAEQIYYRALNVYLTRSSQFLDMRASIIQSALDLYGQSEADAAATAFTTVGIGSGNSGGNGGGTPGNPMTDLSVNPGDEYILFTEANHNNLYINTPEGTIISDPLTSLDPLSKPSITDDGSLIVFVASDNTLRTIAIDWFNGSANLETLSDSPTWRNAAISKDGNRIAALTTNNDNQILIFDLSQNGAPGLSYELYNPTFTEGISTGNVEYADVLEWDHSGEFLIYDAYNIIPNQSGTDIDYWDIGFMRVWDNAADNFGDGNITKLFNSLPENTSIGNPTFSKNSPYIMAFDFIDNNDGTYFLLASNIETGDVSTLRQNGELAYPNFSIQDDQVIFNEENTLGDKIIASIELEGDKITPLGSAFVLLSNGFSGASWGAWFANGQRTLVDIEEVVFEEEWAKINPTVSQGQFQLDWQLENAEELQINVRDLMGKSVWQKSARFPTGQHQENLTIDVPSGVYLITLNAGKKSFVKRIIVQ